MAANIFQIWDSLGRVTPFAVRRDNWSSKYYTIVERIECEKLPYGKAFGFAVSNGGYSEHYDYDKKWRNEGLIPCCGCYQWTLVLDADLTIQPPSRDDPVSIDSRILKGSSIMHFGKFRGRTIGEIFEQEPSYLAWALENIDSFILAPISIAEFERRGKAFSVTAKEVNNAKIKRLTV